MTLGAMERAADAASLRLWVLIVGAPGTGKASFARALHERSAQREGPFVEYPCWPHSGDIVDQHLFGAEPGKATNNSGGIVAAADQGTLFLRAVHHLPATAQAKLAEFGRSGWALQFGGERLARFRVQVVASTTVDLRKAVAEQRFRSDLFYKMKEAVVEVPTLRQRIEEVPALVRKFGHEAIEELGNGGMQVSQSLVDKAVGLDWPGNISELKREITRAVVRASYSRSENVEGTHLATETDSGFGGLEAPVPTFRGATRHFQAKLVVAALDRAEWNVAEAARGLHLSRSQLYNLMDSFGLKRPLKVLVHES